MIPPATRLVTIPYAFDTAIGYWTGELDWALLSTALREIRLDGPEPCCIDAWVARARAGSAPPLRFGGVRLSVREASVVVEGDADLVQAVAQALEERLGRG